MALTKNYAILEVQKILLDADETANKLQHLSHEDMYLEMAKELYPQLEQVFRLVFEPTFNEPNFSDEKLLMENEDLKLQVEQLTFEITDEVKVLKDNLEVSQNNEKILLNANNQLLDSYKESLKGKDDIIELLKDMVIKLAVGGSSEK